MFRPHYFVSFDNRDYSPPIFSLSEALSRFESMKEASSFFDSDLKAIWNFMPADVEPPFGKTQDIAEEVLVLQSPGTVWREGPIRMILLSQYDADHLKKSLMDPNLSLPKGSKIGVYNLHVGAIQHAKGAAFTEADQKSEAFQRLLVQAKFATGVSTYSRKEEAILIKWLKANDPKKMLSFFYGTILKHRPEARNRFHHSLLKKIFEDLGAIQVGVPIDGK
ncbi:MAG: hypothetical protein FJZ64_03390 [Chlamydiae bacterium]|nr:hypothetical protein [Chlamydiota bacterium]